MAQLHDSESGPRRIRSEDTGEEVPDHWPKRGEMDSHQSLNIVRIVNILMIIGFAALVTYMTHSTMWHVKAGSRWQEQSHDK
jgi:hypothetical protein